MTENYLNLPTYENQSRIADSLEIIAAEKDAKVTDPSNAPGPKVLVAGDRSNGFYGFVQPSEFGLIEGNPASQKEMSGANLAIAIGLTQGVAENDNTPWMKFSRGGQIYLVPMKPIRRSLSWNSIYNQGAVYGDNTVGINPPNGRAGKFLSVEGESNSFIIQPDAVDRGFLHVGATLGKVGDRIVVRGFANAGNNGEFIIQSITDTAITVDGNLTTEPKGRSQASIYKKGDEVVQNRKVTIGGNQYQVKLLKGGASDPLDSYADADRGLAGGDNNEWENLIMPLHEKATTKDWAYKAYVSDTVEDWGVGLTDRDLVTHHTHGNGSYSWMQDTVDTIAWTRLVRGDGGVSYGNHGRSWNVHTSYGWRPCLALLS